MQNKTTPPRGVIQNPRNHDSREALSCVTWMGDDSCSGPREGPEQSVLEPARAVLTNARTHMEIGESVDNDLRSAASRDQTLGRARAATEWLDDVGVLADTGCQGAATEDTRKREESDAATATGVTTEWLDDVGVSDQPGPAVQASTGAPAWVNAFGLDDVGISDCEPAAQRSTGEPYDDIPGSRCTATIPCCILCADVC